ncbi:hypothetical protein LTR16_001712 [Cryomyces antarcticus]|uniref:Alpha/beta hydrolase fold-3 domain-containing protein n=1 Tax=Cryomyces antarcticus TaxID=329879 RepID=A0ABR0LZB1_9PEZI|nr:hypothetical protein LTR16_001712 [Cryomyces antarcticus]
MGPPGPSPVLEGPDGHRHDTTSSRTSTTSQTLLHPYHLGANVASKGPIHTAVLHTTRLPCPKQLHGKGYPVVVNFHGGGFTLGTATDDARWCDTVVGEVNAVVVSVDYRLAPENPFPTAVEDGVDAILYLAEHAEELGIDVDRMAVSGFSSGGNMSFTVPLRLQNELLGDDGDGDGNSDGVGLGSTESTSVPQKATGARRTLLRARRDVDVKAIVAWYPSTDYTQTREQRRTTSARKDQELPALLTTLFDDSYLQPPTLDMRNPYLSPGVAPQRMLARLPHDIVLFTCEWDMLLAEAQRMRDRLQHEAGKNVVYHMVPGVPHGWDKAPNPLTPTPRVAEHYLLACKELRRVFKTQRRASLPAVL